MVISNLEISLAPYVAQVLKEDQQVTIASHFFMYHKVPSSGLSQLEAHSKIFRLFMKGKFDAYVL